MNQESNCEISFSCSGAPKNCKHFTEEGSEGQHFKDRCIHRLGLDCTNKQAIQEAIQSIKEV